MHIIIFFWVHSIAEHGCGVRNKNRVIIYATHFSIKCTTFSVATAPSYGYSVIICSSISYILIISWNMPASCFSGSVLRWNYNYIWHIYQLFSFAYIIMKTYSFLYSSWWRALCGFLKYYLPQAIYFYLHRLFSCSNEN